MVWNTKVGIEKGCVNCPVCNTNKITQLTFEAGHIIAEAKGGLTTVDNLEPICSTCNKSMGTQNLNEYKAIINKKMHDDKDESFKFCWCR